MKEKLENSNFRFLLGTNFSTFLKAIEKKWRTELAWNSDKNSEPLACSAANTNQTEIPRFSGTARRRSFNALPVKTNALVVGSVAQSRRRSNSVVCGRSERHNFQGMCSLNSPTEEWSETFVAQDGVLTTNFCSTELWRLCVSHWKGQRNLCLIEVIPALVSNETSTIYYLLTMNCTIRSNNWSHSSYFSRKRKNMPCKTGKTVTTTSM